MESKGLKSEYHFSVSRVETATGRFQAMGRLDATCTAPTASVLDSLGSTSWMVFTTIFSPEL
jgi:hypothetical protein